VDATVVLPPIVFVAVFAAVIVLTAPLSTAATRLAKLEHRSGTSGRPTGVVQVRTVAPRRSHLAHGRIGQKLVNRAKSEVREGSATLLLQAGSRLSVGTYLLLRTLLAIVVAPVAAVLAIAALGFSLPGIGAAALALLVLPRLPGIALKRKAKRRVAEIDSGLPDALDLLVVCVEGGLSLDGALMQVATRSRGAVAEELRKLQQDIAAGMSRRNAFAAMSARSPSDNLSIVSSSIVQADKMGMSIANTLRSLTEQMRNRRRQAAEEKARKAPVKMMPILIFFMIPSLFAVILGQAALMAMEMM
jgi:tight adherence protein C